MTRIGDIASRMATAAMEAFDKVDLADHEARGTTPVVTATSVLIPTTETAMGLRLVVTVEAYD